MARRTPVNRGDNEAFMAAILGASSRYLAILDGDDYWIRDEKLQRQIDYLDQHPGCALCFTTSRLRTRARIIRRR